MSGKTSIEWTDRTVNPIRARNLETGANRALLRKGLNRV